MAELVVVEAAGELRLLQVRGNVLVGHFLESSLEQIDFLDGGYLLDLLVSLPSALLRTSSSLHARPPPVEVTFRFFEMPYSWRSMVSEVGVYVAGGAAICIVGDIGSDFQVPLVSN